MIFLYVSFFILLNLLIFNILINKELIKINSLTRKLILTFLILIVFFHFFFFKENYIINEKFLHLFFSSLMIIVFYFGSKIPIYIVKKKHKIENENPTLVLFNFMRLYIIPCLITLIQIIMLFDF